jgi:predicted acyltransferase (DUF342 family)
MTMKNRSVGILKKIWVISIALLILSMIFIPTQDTVVSESIVVSVELKAGWNLINVPESISASDLALKSKHITSIVHMSSDDYHVSYIPEHGITDFICEPYEVIYIYSKADTNLKFTIDIPSGNIIGDLIVPGDAKLNRNLSVDGSVSVSGNLEINSMNVSDDLIVNGNLKVNEDLVIGNDCFVDGNLIVSKNLTVGDLTITHDMTINEDLTVSGDAFISGDSVVAGDTTIIGNIIAADLSVNNVTINEDLTIKGNISVIKDIIVGGDSIVTGDMEVMGNLTASDLTVGNVSITEDLTINGNLSVMKDLTVGGDSTVAGDMDVRGNITAKNLIVDEDVLVKGNLSVIKDITIGGNLTVGNFTVTDSFTYDGNYSITENMTVGGDLVVSGNITGIALGNTADYVIGRDATGEIYAKNGRTGNIDFKSANATEVIQSAIDALVASDRGAGMIYLKRSDYGEIYNIPLRFGVSVDYTIDSPILVRHGISIISDGALLNVAGLNDTVLRLNPEGYDYGSTHLIWKISGLAFVGHKDNTNTIAIHAYNWQYPLIIDNIHTEEVTNPIKIEGTAYRTVVQNCLFIVGAGNRGEAGVHIFKGRGPYPPNGATVVNSDVSTFKTGIKVDDGYGIRVTSNYLEGNGIAIDSSGGSVNIVGNYIQPGENGTGVYIYGGTIITGNTFLQGGGAANSTGVHAARSEGQVLVSGNMVATDSTDTVFFYSSVPIRATIVGNTVALKVGATSKFIDAELTGSTISGNHISRGNPAIRQRMSPAWQENVFSGNTFFSSATAIITGGRDHVLDNAFSACQTDIQLIGPFNVVRGNNLRGFVATINTTGMGGGCTIENNIGFVTENSGTTSAGTSIDVSHGLDGTPDHVIVSPLGQTNQFYVTNKGPTTFTIVSQASVEFDWFATYKP